MLKFTPANTKVRKLAKIEALAQYLDNGRKIFNFDLLAGHTCPMAKLCFSKVVDGKVVDGKDTEFRCFAASLEALYPASFAAHKHNTDMLKGKGVEQITQMLLHGLPSKAGIVRIHSAGDYFSESYFRAWLYVANTYPYKLFYGYTKMTPFMVKHRKDMPANFQLTASYGGKRDDLIGRHKLPSSKVVFSEAEAAKLGLEIDDDDSHAANPTVKNFALLIHGVQPAGSDAGKAVHKLRKAKVA